MKKNFSSVKWKHHLQRRSIYEEKRHLKKWKIFKDKRKKIKSSFVVNTSYNAPNIVYTPIKAPSEFSLVNNTEETIQFFLKSRNFLKAKTNILFDLSGIKILTPDAITFLVANVESVNFHYGTGIKGNIPEDDRLKQLFLESGFYNYVISRMPRNTTTNYLLHKETYNKVEPDIAKEACQIGIKHSFENNQICEPLYEIIIECMSNTNNHADLKERGIYDWWLFVYQEPISKITYYTFLDLGIGIFESIPVKQYKKFLLLTQVISNIDLVNDLTSGKIKSRTDQPERGRGIPQIFLNSKYEFIRNFRLISNDVYADFSSNNKKKLSTPLQGTMYSWELHPKN